MKLLRQQLKWFGAPPGPEREADTPEEEDNEPDEEDPPSNWLMSRNAAQDPSKGDWILEIVEKTPMSLEGSQSLLLLLVSRLDSIGSQKGNDLVLSFLGMSDHPLKPFGLGSH